jgi:NHL repeat
MSEDQINKDEEIKDEALEVADEVEEEEIEEDALTEAEMDEFDEVEGVEEVEKEVGAKMVIGQSDFNIRDANRGADDPGDNTLSEPQFVCRYGDMLFVSDWGNHRVLAWNQFPEENGEPASLVLGQEDFSDSLENRGISTTLDEMTSGLGDENLEGFTISKPEEDTIASPAGVCVIDGKLYVSDSGNHRVLRWNGLPSEDGEVPGLVLGQDNLECGEANRRGLVGSGSLFFPFGIRSGDDQQVYVADKDNHRILIWQKIPFNDGWNADVCLGQFGMDEREPNRGDFDNVTPETLSFPTSVFYHAETGKIFVVDQGNNRVLIWNKVPSNNGVPADLVLGQKDFYSREVNGGLGIKRADSASMYFPTDVVFGRKGLFVSDSGNHRVLVWNELPTENGQPADMVIGQNTFASHQYNRGGEVSDCTLNDPYGLFLDEDPEDEEDIGKLYICDRGNSRVVIWEELPDQHKDDEEEVIDHPAIEDPELLMGNDDDFMDDEEEEEAPKELA